MNFRTLMIVFLSVFSVTAFAQREMNRFAGSVFGSVEDASTLKPVGYANVVLLSGQDSTQITGTMSNEAGEFTIQPVRPGLYFLQIRFMGYKTHIVEQVTVGRGSHVDVGVIAIDPTTLLMEGVSVEADKPAITFEIDKKVVAVSEMPTAVSGNAVDVLENVPSVTVDIEGNVSLRGSGNFTVLMDGRPTVLDASDVLQQTPAGAIENIEIITNPSVKYDPEGTAGIINLVMKKGKTNGLRGMSNLNVGLRDKYGADVLLEARQGKFGFSFGLDYRRYLYHGSRAEKNETFRDGWTSYIHSSGDSEYGRMSSGLRGSIDYQMSASDFLTLNLRAGSGSHGGRGDRQFNKWAEPGNVREQTLTKTDSDRSRDFLSADLVYQRRFQGRKGHELQGRISYRSREGDEYNLNEEFDVSGMQINGRKTTEKGPSDEIEIKFDYTLPMSESRKFEAGYEHETDLSEDGTGVYDYSIEFERLVYRPEYSHRIRYDQQTHAAYAIFADTWRSLGIQAGMRAEYTGRRIELEETRDVYEIARWDYFPTLHSAYQFRGNHQIMASYTRRIQRPRGYYLEPFETWMDAYTVRKGNPELKPEYIDAFEAGYQTNVGKNLFSAEAYYRQTQNAIERVRSVYAPNVTLQTVENVGEEYAFGSEFMLNMDLAGFWNVNFMGNLYRYRIEGVLYGSAFSRESNNWNVNLNQMFKLNKTRIQFNARYVSPSVRSQGRREGFFMTDAALRQEFLNGDLTATLQIRDIFGTGRYEYTSEGPEFTVYNKYTRESPFVMLNLRYNINNYKADQRERGRNGDDEGPSEGEF